VSSGRRAFLSAAAVSAALSPTAGFAALATEESLDYREDVAAIRRLYREYAAGLAAMPRPATEPASVRVFQDPAEHEDSIRIAVGGLTASARFPCLLQTAIPHSGHGSLIEMARLQGNRETRWENVVIIMECVKETGGWRSRETLIRMVTAT
jgi:hypothetical protein